MTFERVLMVWDIYDGPRSGLANINGAPHYFTWEPEVDESVYNNIFKLAPISDELLVTATENWAIYRAWEASYHSGQTDTSTHPGRGGISQIYDELDQKLKAMIADLVFLPQRYIAEFRVASDQGDTPEGAMRLLEAKWAELAEDSKD